MRKCIRLVLAAGLLAWLTGLTAAQTPPAKVLRVVPSADLTQLDPTFASVVITRIYGLMVYETLFAWDSKLQPRPQMVRDWSTATDGLSWRFTLRPGLAFHDGQRVTTADVIPSLRRWMERDVVGQKLGAAVTGMDAVDADTFEIRLSKPYPAMLFSLGSGIGQVPVIMGTGTNSTAETVARTQEAANLAASAALVVVPYYNRPPQSGLLAHFKTVAENSDIPIILYNVPSRTVVKLELDTILKLSKEEKIVGIKEATGDMHFAGKIRSGVSKEFTLLSGDDASFGHFINAGGDGIISVGSHVFPREFVTLQAKEAGSEKKFEASLATINNLYLEPNPIPVKMALFLMISKRVTHTCSPLAVTRSF